jgi:hypothetical protein
MGVILIHQLVSVKRTSNQSGARRRAGLFLGGEPNAAESKSSGDFPLVRRASADARQNLVCLHRGCCHGRSPAAFRTFRLGFTRPILGHHRNDSHFRCAGLSHASLADVCFGADSRAGYVAHLDRLHCGGSYAPKASPTPNAAAAHRRLRRGYQRAAQPVVRREGVNNPVKPRMDTDISVKQTVFIQLLNINSMVKYLCMTPDAP